MLEDFLLDNFMYEKFEILSEEDEEIDIEAINEFGTNEHEAYISHSSTDSEKEKELRKYIVNNIKDINILIKTVKQLNKKLNEPNDNHIPRID